MTPTEIALGYVFGQSGSLPPPRDRSISARRSLEAVVHRALERPPCGVSFSGGRDSSLVLAVATHVARREGLPEPVPVTWVFPDAPDTDEAEWQETVVRHLGLDEWQRVTLHGEFDLVGPLAQRHLVEHGVLWPPTIHGDVPILEPVRGGTLLDGEGGDEVLGVVAHRIAAVNFLVKHPRPLRWRRVRRALRAAAPGRIRAWHGRRRQPPSSWLRPGMREELARQEAATEAAAPWSFAESVRLVPCRRSQRLLIHNRRILARAHDVEVSSPLLAAEFVQALARDGGWLGRGDRTVVLRHIAGDLLPDAVLARHSKAGFGGAFQSDSSRAFAETWDGEGLDDQLVDVEELRRIWRTGETNALTGALLQQAWLASQSVRNAKSG